ncbi:NAD(P)H-dependent glycerol-3-phosphate dehydrogenase, partial [Enterococcus faecalis]|uniref:NAD(P)H-dependent glycerol-3-phosphate dehydrogenase n=1 Tax=Enterococcus faecalis TaxID=1351 RepID=UPI003CC63AED
ISVGWDYIVTCTSVHSGIGRAGYLVGRGHKLDEVFENRGMIVEGVSTTKAAYELALQLEVEMPIRETIYFVLYNDEDVQ